MKELILFCTLFLSLASAVFGGDLEFPETVTLQDGKVYEDVRLISRTPSEVVFRYSGGVKNMKISKLSDELQSLLDYCEIEAQALEDARDEKTAERLKGIEERAKVREAAKMLAERQKHCFMIRGYVHQVLDNGILIQGGEPTDLVYYGIRVSESEAAKRRYVTYPKPRPPREFGMLYVEDHPQLEYFTDGDVVDIDVYRDGTFKFEGTTRKQFLFLKSH